MKMKKNFMPITLQCSECSNEKEIKIDVAKYGYKTLEEAIKEKGLDNWLCEECKK